MPYIKPINRDVIGPLNDLPIRTEGELNYAITRLIHNWLLRYGKSYASLNAVIGVLECAKLELYRQIAAPYEREKHKLNGPISELDKNGE